METIKVNMNPNPLDVQTIHASQNDGEARQWGFELHNNGDVIDSSEVTDQLVFKAYKGGTEQLLPENTSTPTTSPFLGDIKYPQGLLTDQEFIYRESPTESDGLAKITDIKGNTIVWNQQNYDNFTDTSKWLVNDGSKYSVSVSGNVLTVTCTGAPDNNASVRISGVNSIVGHKYLLLSDVKSPKTVGFRYLYSPVASGSLDISVSANVWTQFGKVVQINSSSGFYIYFNSNRDLAQGDVVEIKNHQIIDLTQMFGTTKADEIYAMEQAQSGSGIAYFKTYYPLPYYDYNQGTLLSFNGNGLKIVGRNLLDPQRLTNLPDITKTENGWSGTAPNWLRNTDNATWQGFDYLPNVQYYAEATALSVGATWIRLRITYSDGSETNSNSITSGNSGKMSVLSTANKTVVSVSVYYGSYGTNISELTDFAIMVSNSTNEYEPYTESTLSIPLDEFPDGMDGINDARDYKNEIGYAKRIWKVDLGSVSWTLNTEFRTSSLSNIIAKPSNNSQVANVVCSKYITTSVNGLADKNIGVTSGGGIRILDSAYSDAETFANAMSGVYLYYELATPLENYEIVDLGTLDWAYTNGMFQTLKSNISPLPSSNANVLCSKYSYNSTAGVDKTINQTSNYFRVYDSSYTDADIFKQAMSGVYLLYEKENPQGFTTASLVTENAEIPLSNNDGTLIGKCTEELSAEPGFHDAKIKLSDADGECYSNKIQLHVERSPQ